MQMQISQHGERKSTSQFVSDLDAPHFAINSDAEDKSSALSFAFKVLPYGQQYGNISGRYNTDISVYLYIPRILVYLQYTHTTHWETGKRRNVPRHTEAVKKFKYPPHIYANVFQCTFSVFKYACPWLLVVVFLLAFGFVTSTEKNKWLFKLNKQFWHVNRMFFWLYWTEKMQFSSCKDFEYIKNQIIKGAYFF